MAGLVPAIHVFLVALRKKDVDARHKAGHDESDNTRISITHHAKLELAPPFASLDA
jgi:hypothetical protein